MFFWIFMLVLLFFGALQVAGMAGDADAGESNQLLYLTVLGVGMIVAGVVRLLISGDGARYLMSWATVIAIVVTAFGYRGEIQDVIDRLTDKRVPSVAMTSTGGEAELRRAWDGHYRADARINGVEIRLLVDTGASMVVLPYEAVEKLGIDPESLDFSVPVTTANGQSTVAPIRLSEVAIGNVRVRNVHAAIAHPGRLETGLLGMSFLDEMTETVFSGDRLILRQGRIAGFDSSYRLTPEGKTPPGMFSPDELKDQPQSWN